MLRPSHAPRLLRSACHSLPDDMRPILRHVEDDRAPPPPPTRRCRRTTSLHPADSLKAVFTILANGVIEIYLAHWCPLMNPHPAIIHHCGRGPRRAQDDFLSPFVHLEFH